MKVTRFLGTTLLLLAAGASSAFAEGAVSLTWDACTGPVNKSILPGTQASAFASVTNHNTPHKAYEIWMLLGAGAAGPMRDAWRFDAAGCEGSSFITIDHLAPASVVKTCPSFQGALQSLQIKDYSFDATTGKCQAVCANSYPAGQTSTINPASRYFLARFLFDFSFGVNGPSDPGATCGGLEVPVCIHLTKYNYIVYDAANPGTVEQRTWLVQQEFITSNDPSNSTGCPGATPTRPTTWGSVKSQYHM